MIHYAKLENSQRLQELFAILQDGKAHSAFDIQAKTKSMAVHTDIAELRENGYEISQWYDGQTARGRSRSMYRMTAPLQMKMAL